MTLPHRIAAGGIIFKDDSVLLVRYFEKGDAKTFLVGPGGALLDNENIVQAVVRETKEETGVLVEPRRVIAIEDLIGSQFKMIKVWMICDFISGEVHRTEEAEQEGIVDAAWFTKGQLARETVYPSLIMEYDWDRLREETRRIEIPPSRRMND